MNVKLFFALEFVLGLLACRPFPVPEPDPEPEITVHRDDFSGQAFYFEMGENSGNLSYIDSAQAVLQAASGSGWIYTPESFLLTGLAIETELAPSTDFCVELSPTLDPRAENGFHLAPTRLRCYIYDLRRLLHVEYAKAGVRLIDTTVTEVAIPVPSRIRLRFTADTLYYEYFSGVWQTAYMLKESWQGRWYIALSSAWRHGVSRVDYVEISGPSKNFEEEAPPEFGDATIFWNTNLEPDLAGYNVYRLRDSARDSFFTWDTLYQFWNIKKGLYKFFLTAKDTAGNESAPSDTVSF